MRQCQAWARFERAALRVDAGARMPMSPWTIYSWIFCILLATAIFESLSWLPFTFRRGICVYKRTEQGWKVPGNTTRFQWQEIRGISLRWVSGEHALFRVRTRVGFGNKRMPAGILLGELTLDPTGAGHVVLKVPLSAVLLLLVIAAGLALAAREGTSPAIAYVVGFVLVSVLYILVCLIDAVSMLYGIGGLKE